MMKLDELRFGLDYNISKDFLNSPGDPPPRLRRQGSLSLYLQYHTGRKNGIGCFARITKINAVLLLRALKRRKAWSIALVLETDFAQEEGAQGKKIQEEGGEVMLQASFLTSRVGLKLHNKVKKNPKPAKQFPFFPPHSNVHQTRSGMSPGSFSSLLVFCSSSLAVEGELR